MSHPMRGNEGGKHLSCAFRAAGQRETPCEAALSEGTQFTEEMQYKVSIFLSSNTGSRNKGHKLFSSWVSITPRIGFHTFIRWLFSCFHIAKVYWKHFLFTSHQKWQGHVTSSPSSENACVIFTKYSNDSYGKIFYFFWSCGFCTSHDFFWKLTNLSIAFSNWRFYFAKV